MHDIISPSNVSPSRVTSSLTPRNQLRALLYLLIVWSIGTLIWESFAWGGEEYLFRHRWREQETSLALKGSGIPEFYRLEKNRRMRVLLLQAIQTEEAILAMRQSTSSWKQVPNQVQIDPNAMVVDPIMDSMFVAKEQWIDAYRRLDDSRPQLRLSDRAGDRLLWDEAVGSSLPGLVRLITSRLDFENAQVTPASAVKMNRPAIESPTRVAQKTKAKTVGFRMPSKHRETLVTEIEPVSVKAFDMNADSQPNQSPKILQAPSRILEVSEFLLD